MNRRALTWIVVAMAAALHAGPSAAGQETATLTFGEPVEIVVGESAPFELGFTAETAGLLNAFVVGADETDLHLSVVDDTGQTVMDGSVDRDLYGRMGTETISVMLRVPGQYVLRVHARGGPVQAHVESAWVPAPSVTLPPDPDGKPTSAYVLMPGSSVDDSLDPREGDAVDWYAITSEEGGYVAILVEAAEGDLALELYVEGSFEDHVERSDQDLQGVSGNESLMASIGPGETVYVKVVPFSTSAGRIEYSIRARSM